MSSDKLSAVEGKIAADLARRPECFITHPTEVRLLQTTDPAAVQEMANRNGWRVVRRLGGRQWQFYNDTTERMLNELGTTPASSPHSAPVEEKNEEYLENWRETQGEAVPRMM